MLDGCRTMLELEKGDVKWNVPISFGEDDDKLKFKLLARLLWCTLGDLYLIKTPYFTSK